MNGLQLEKTSFELIKSLRDQYLSTVNYQIRYDACHSRGWSDSWLIELGGSTIGYGSVKGLEELAHRNTLFEFFLLDKYSDQTTWIFEEFLSISGVSYLEAQSNDPVLRHLIYQFGTEICSEVLLWEDFTETKLSVNDVNFRLKQPSEASLPNKSAGSEEYILQVGQEKVAEGGFLTHYNFPFADLYMEVESGARSQGYGSYILQEIKKECYRSGRVPAARCNIVNYASRKTLKKAGFRPCGYMLKAKVKSSTMP